MKDIDTNIAIFRTLQRRSLATKPDGESENLRYDRRCEAEALALQFGPSNECSIPTFTQAFQLAIFRPIHRWRLNMAQGRSLYWFSPASMFGGLLGGIVFAIGHHLFYHNLNGQIVSDGAFLNTPISEQQANIAIGTAFAFLVNSCLVFATTVAFIQVFWTLAHKQKSTNQPTLGKLNAGYSATRNPLALFNVFLWWTFPLLLSVATVTWYV